MEEDGHLPSHVGVTSNSVIRLNVHTHSCFTALTWHVDRQFNTAQQELGRWRLEGIIVSVPTFIPVGIVLRPGRERLGKSAYGECRQLHVC